MCSTLRTLWFSCLTLMLVFVGASLAHGLLIDFLPSERVGSTRERGFFPFLELHLTDGSSLRTSRDQVIDTFIDEGVPSLISNAAVALRLEAARGRRKVVLLSFDG